MLQQPLLGEDLESCLLPTTGMEAAPPCGPASLASGPSSPSSRNTSNRSTLVIDQDCQATGLPHQQPPGSDNQQRRQRQQRQQQSERLSSAFAPYAAAPGLMDPTTTATKSASTSQPSDDGSGPDPATVAKLAQLLLGTPQASNQLSVLVSALKSGQPGTKPAPLSALGSCGSSILEEGRNLQLKAASGGACPKPLSRNDPDQQQGQHQCLVAGAPAPITCASTADTLERLAHLLVEVPSLSDSLEKALWGGLEAQQQRRQAQEEPPPAKRSKLSSSPAVVAPSGEAPAVAWLCPAPLPQQVAANSKLGARLAGTVPPVQVPSGVSASSKLSWPLTPVAQTSTVAAAGQNSQPASIAAGSRSSPAKLWVAQQLPLTKPAPVLRPAAHQQQRTATAEPMRAAATSGAAGAQARELAGASMDEIEQALLLWRYMKARQQTRNAETALVMYCTQRIRT
ncbi:hypothetical protein N2152v2_003616 [Parachlorella kessleri]